MTYRPTATSLARIAGLALALASVMPDFALAQGAGPLPGSNRRTKEVSVPPSALPGAQVDNQRVIPADKSVIDLSPNDALFDAITRGDLQAAQEAINHGADFNARNVLGLTPLDESIDLGRNNITFLLLSLRGGDSTTPTNAPAKPVSRPEKLTTPLAAPAATLREATGPKSATSNADSNRQAAGPVTAAPAAGKAGTPNPQSGFLGFGG